MGDVMPTLSVLDLSPICEGGDATQALNNSRDLAQHCEKAGYHRYWVAEHHNMRGIASAATSVVISHIAGGTDSIRVGSGGIMLPNHSPLMVAEQFGTLEALYPGRIDLGLGRAPGTDGVTAHALRRTLHSDPNQFPQDVVELKGYLSSTCHPQQRVTAVPGFGSQVPLYILGSSLFGAQLAAILGLPFAFASHFAPDAMMRAIKSVSTRIEPSEQLATTPRDFGLQHLRGRHRGRGPAAALLRLTGIFEFAKRQPRTTTQAERALRRRTKRCPAWYVAAG